MHRTLVVARKDFEDAVQSKMLWSLIALMVGLVALIYFTIWWNIDDPGVTDVVGIASALFQLVVPLIALIAGYRSVVGERESGSIKVLLSLPPSRGAVVLGKFLGRAAVVTATFALAGLAMAVFGLVLFGTLHIQEWVLVTAIAVAIGVTFVGIAVGVSALVNTRGQAMAGVIGLYLTFMLFWDLITAGIHRLVVGELPGNPGDTFEAWYVFLQWVNPIEAHGILSDAVFEETFGAFTIPIFAPQEAAALEFAVAGDVPWYLTEAVLVPVLVVWILVPVWLGYWRFSRVDLG